MIFVGFIAMWILVGFLVFVIMTLIDINKLIKKYGKRIFVLTSNFRKCNKNTSKSACRKSKKILVAFLNLLMWPITLPKILNKVYAEMEQEMEYISSKMF